MENNEVLEAVENAIENDALVVNYNVPQPTAKETLITTGVIAGVALVALGVTLGTVKVVDVTSDAIYKLHEKRKAKKAARRAQCAAEDQTNPEEK
jgi:hypothetical protein